MSLSCIKTNLPYINKQHKTYDYRVKSKKNKHNYLQVDILIYICNDMVNNIDVNALVQYVSTAPSFNQYKSSAFDKKYDESCDVFSIFRKNKSNNFMSMADSISSTLTALHRDLHRSLFVTCKFNEKTKYSK